MTQYHRKSVCTLSFFCTLIFLTGFLTPVWGADFSGGTSCHTATSGSGGDFKGEAAVVFFYFNDSYLTTLAQETMDLSLAYQNTKHQVLLIDENETDTTKFIKSEAINSAEDTAMPTKANFFNAIRTVAEQGYVVNLWIFSHGSRITNSNGEEITYFVAKDGKITSEDILAELGSDGCDEVPIRMVYTVACYNSGMNDKWQEVGAKSVMGARWINFYPIQYTRFANDWADGKTFSKALSNSNTSSSRSMVQTYIAALGLQYYNQGECGFIPDVLGKNDCAKWFFKKGGDYILGSDYDASLSGAVNMNKSSYKVIAGNKDQTYTTVQSWQIED